MLQLNITTQFRKDYKKLKKQGKDLALLEAIIDKLLAQEPLLPQNHDHALSGKFKGMRECHVQPDWLHMYKQDDERLILTAFRTGSRAELLKM